jgi:hypothetical protein
MHVRSKARGIGICYSKLQEESGHQLRPLTGAELSLVAGGLGVITGPAPVVPPIRRPEPPVVNPGGPIRRPEPNPGGPILITCIVGQGCMTKPA